MTRVNVCNINVKKKCIRKVMTMIREKDFAK